MLGMKIKEGDVEFRRDSLILAAGFLIISLFCTKMIVNRLDDIKTLQVVSTEEARMALKGLEERDIKEKEITQQLKALEVTNAAIAKWQVENRESVRQLKALVAQRKKEEESQK